MVASRYVCFNAICFMQGFFQQLWRNVGRVDFLAGQLKFRVGNDVQRCISVFVSWTTVGLAHIINQTFIERPCIDLAFPVINDRVAEAIDFGLLVRHAGGQPSGFCCLQGRCRWICDQSINSGLQLLGGCQAVFKFCFSNIRIVRQNISFFCCLSAEGKTQRHSNGTNHKVTFFHHVAFSSFSSKYCRLLVC